MASLATPEFLSSIKKTYPPAGSAKLPNPWYFVAAVALSASNAPDAVPLVFDYAIKDAKESNPAWTEDDSRLLARKMKDALFKSGMLSGFPKVSR